MKKKTWWKIAGAVLTVIGATGAGLVGKKVYDKKKTATATPEKK